MAAFFDHIASEVTLRVLAELRRMGIGGGAGVELVSHRSLPADVRRRVREACARGDGPDGAIKVGRSWTFTRAALDAWREKYAAPTRPNVATTETGVDAEARRWGLT